LTVLVLGLAGLSVARAGVGTPTLSDEAKGDDWASYGRTFSEDHYSPLTQITDSNIRRLGLAWSYDLPAVSTLSAPLAIDGVLYFATGYSVIRAMDARSGKLLWTYDPDVPAHAGLKLRSAWGARGIAAWDNKIYTGTQDGRLIAIDAGTGKALWSVLTTEPGDARAITGPPRVFNGKIVIGHAGSEFSPLRGYVTAYDAETGKQLWRFYTVPGDPNKGFENSAMAMAARTWTGPWWKYGGGGTVWNAMAYDPKFNRVYIGTSNGQPWNSKIRSPGGGDNLFLASIVALDADTGAYVWHYQTTPGDVWDYDADMDIELADVAVDGKTRPVLMQASKNGFFYVIDRATGKLLSAEKFGKVTWASRIDLKTGRPVETDSARYPNGVPRLVYPGPAGAHNIFAMSFNPVTGLAYIPEQDFPMVYADIGVDREHWNFTPHMGQSMGIGMPPAGMTAPPSEPSLLAWNPALQKMAWRVPLEGRMNGSTMTTAGNLVFQGHANGMLVAYAADSGKALWSFDAQVGILAQPITYLAGGRQYVTLLSGYRGTIGSITPSKDWEFYSQKRRVLTFAIDGKATLPPVHDTGRALVDDPAFTVDPRKAALGGAIVATYCSICHGPGLQAGGAAPDLRRSPIPRDRQELQAVLKGALLSEGMPAFPELTADQIDEIQHFIRQTARRAIAQSRH
jgi:quinohemoprotein ethanol dehydrogenase